MEALSQVFRDALNSVYDPTVLSFAVACGLVALGVCVLDWVDTLYMAARVFSGSASVAGVPFSPCCCGVLEPFSAGISADWYNSSTSRASTPGS